LPGLGMTVEGLAPHPVEDEKSALVPLTIPECEKTPEYESQRDYFLKNIRALLDKNKAIPKDSFCTMPEAM
ncbi:hypothetical protein BGZ98_006822, partial [Dissophora globulifera]